MIMKKMIFSGLVLLSVIPAQAQLFNRSSLGP